MFLLEFLLTLIGVLLGVAFFTLVERKVMGLAHYRKGPNKVLLAGLTQPIADATKLLTKEYYKFPMTKMMMFYSGPTLSLLLMFISWGWMEMYYQILMSSMSIMVIFAIMGLVSYSMMLMSWGSNSKYSILGGHRSVAQILSYEVCMFLFFLVVAALSLSLNYKMMIEIQQGYWLMLFSVPTFFMWTTLCMAESNRTPFDNAEGESEIVSGFNIEYGGGLFALIFISEYGMIMLLSMMTSLIFMGGNISLVKTFLFCMLYVWVRTSFPRLRYDKLMMLSWKVLLPFSISLVAISNFMLI